MFSIGFHQSAYKIFPELYYFLPIVSLYSFALTFVTIMVFAQHTNQMGYLMIGNDNAP